MTLTYAASFKHTLQLQALLSLGQKTFWSQNVPVFKCHEFPPGLRQFFKNNFWWVTCVKSQKKENVKPSSGSMGPSQPRLRRKKAISTDESDSDSWNEHDLETKQGCGKSPDDASVPGVSSPTPAPQPGRGRHIPENKRLRLRSFNRES